MPTGTGKPYNFSDRPLMTLPVLKGGVFDPASNNKRRMPHTLIYISGAAAAFWRNNYGG
jgi:hypothetical protein